MTILPNLHKKIDMKDKDLEERRLETKNVLERIS